MSWIEDARKLMQDFVTPELLAISAGLDAAEKMDGERDKLAAERHAVLLDKLDTSRRKLMLHVELTIVKSRIADFEARQKDSSTSAAGGIA